MSAWRRVGKVVKGEQPRGPTKQRKAQRTRASRRRALLPPRENTEFVLWLWRQLLFLVPATAVAIYIVATVIEGHPVGLGLLAKAIAR